MIDDRLVVIDATRQALAGAEPLMVAAGAVPLPLEATTALIR